MLVSWRGCHLFGCMWYVLLAVTGQVVALVLKVLHSQKLVALQQVGQSVLLFPMFSRFSRHVLICITIYSNKLA